MDKAEIILESSGEEQVVLPLKRYNELMSDLEEKDALVKKWADALRDGEDVVFYSVPVKDVNKPGKFLQANIYKYDPKDRFSPGNLYKFYQIKQRNDFWDGLKNGWSYLALTIVLLQIAILASIHF